jgi:GAF domain-containing protein
VSSEYPVMATTTSMRLWDGRVREPFTSPPDLQEAARVESLRRYHILDTEPDPALQNLVALAAQWCGTEQGAVNLIDAHRQWQAVTVGCPRATARCEDSYCHVTIQQTEPVVVTDARDDERFAELPYTTGELGAPRTDANVQLVSPEGFNLGTSCVFDDRPEFVVADALPVLERLAVQVMALLEARRQAALLARTEQMFRLAFNVGSCTRRPTTP